jgi:hypothetical protein
MNPHRKNRSFSTVSPTTVSHLELKKRKHPALLLALIVLFAQQAMAENLAPLGSGILGYQAAVDNTPGTLLFHVGTAGNINDNDATTRVDNWSAGSDQGQGISFVGVIWPSVRYEQVTTLTLTLATFGDGGWFGPNGLGPGPGGALTADYLIEPSVQVSTNGGASWATVDSTSDYLTALDGMVIGGAMTATFTLSSPPTNINGIRIIGPNGGNAGSDPNGFIGVFELVVDSTFTDADNDGMPDGWEQVNGLDITINDAYSDADNDGLPNFIEYQQDTDPQNPDTDGDGYSDGAEFADSTDPKDPNSIPGNLARTGTGILGTQDAMGVDTAVFNAGLVANINDEILTTRVDTWNNMGTDKLSFVGIQWLEAQTDPVLRLELTLATFTDGGWFGPNNRSPGVGLPLTPAQLTEPSIQVTADGGLTWSNVTHVSDYLTALNGHGIGGGTNPNPTFVTATFILEPPVTNINGIRIIGSEGGVASGGFLGVGELKVYARTDSEPDGMDDDWERKYGLIVGFNDAALDPDADGLGNLEEYLNATDPQKDDTDEDGLKDGAELNTYSTNPKSADTDSDGLNDGAEVNTHGTNPLVADTDGDGYADGLEVQLGSSPISASSVPANLARRSDATGILGTEDFPGGTDTPVFNAGSSAHINDGDLSTRVDTYNVAGLDTLSFVGIVWTNLVTNELTQLELNLATFFDGGWFGYNGIGPGSGGVLSTNLELIEPTVQISTNGGVTWHDVAFTSDYLAALEGHALPAVDFGAPTLATARFQLNPPQTGFNAVRIIGSEGGTASGGFLGVFELLALVEISIPVQLLNPSASSTEFQFEFDTQSGAAYVIQYKNAFTDLAWQELTTMTGDGTRKVVTDAIGAGQRFYRVMRQ